MVSKVSCVRLIGKVKAARGASVRKDCPDLVEDIPSHSSVFPP